MGTVFDSNAEHFILVFHRACLPLCGGLETSLEVLKLIFFKASSNLIHAWSEILRRQMPLSIEN